MGPLGPKEASRPPREGPSPFGRPTDPAADDDTVVSRVALWATLDTGPASLLT